MQQSTPNQIPTYDFDREYDFPPPGSPTPPLAEARPNDYGNSNGLLPDSPIDRPQPKRPLFRRILGAILPSQYQPVATESRHLTPTGRGNDGVFANVVAKPQPARTVQTDNGEVIVVPEESQKDTPPVCFDFFCRNFRTNDEPYYQSYQEAQADAVPPYWETTVHAPGLLSEGGLYIEDLPTGSFFMFCATTFISFFFQFIGFLVTYLLHTTHAAKYGSRAGLGLTLIQYGFSTRMASSMTPPEESGGQGIHDSWEPVVPGEPQNEPPNIEATPITSRDWLSILFMTLGNFIAAIWILNANLYCTGWFLLLTSTLGFWRVKRYERTVQQSSNANQSSAEDVERARPTLFNIDLFGFPPGAGQRRQQDSSPLPSSEPQNQTTPHEDDLIRELRNAGLV
jgi:hypothetical protein